LTQTTEDGPTTISGEIRGLGPGKHGIAICTYGDITPGGADLGAMFNPFGKSHGAPEDEERTVGSLGNVAVGENGVGILQFTDKQVKLLGPHSVIGRSFVVMESEDDCGRGGHELSLITGNSGSRIGYGVIGIAK